MEAFWEARAAVVATDLTAHLGDTIGTTISTTAAIFCE